MNQIINQFSGTVAASPTRKLLCLRPDGAWTTAAALQTRSEQLGLHLVELGVRKNHAVILRTGNVEEFVVATLAIWYAGAVVIPIDPDLGDAEVSQARRAFSAVLEIRVEAGQLSFQPCVEVTPAMKYPDTAMIRLTSGSTGSPRGALVPAEALVADSQAICNKMGIRPEDTNVGVIPLSHSYGFDNLVMPLLTQGSPLLLLDSALPGLILKALQSSRPLVLPLVPYLVDLMARLPAHSLAADSGLRLVISAGAPLSPRTALRFLENFGTPVRSFYGASEAGGITFHSGKDSDLPEGCVGTPLPGVKVEIDEKNLEGLPSGQGRIVISGPAVGSGYAPAPDEDFHDGIFRSLDLGSLDSRGRLHLTGRLSSLMNISGRKVNPVEVERALLALDQVSDAAVLGFSDPLRGERIEAWVVSEPDAAAISIREALSGKLSAHKIPRAIHQVREIPRTSRGKLDRLRLRADG
jgi:long-chain acyl-CoA synthetase